MAKKRLRDIIKILPGYDPYRDAAGYCFDEARAQYYIGLIEDHCIHIEGKVSGQPYILQDHERAVAANIFGWYHDKTKLRRYREVLLYYPRKNSKSTFCACLIIAVMFGDSEPRMQLFSTGADREQASVVHNIVRAMIAASEDLTECVKVYKTTRAIELLADGSIYRALSADAHTKHGLNAHFVAADEIHAYPNGELIDVMKTSMGARTEPLMVYTTTADYARESACNTIYDYAKKARDGIIVDPAFLPVVYELTREEMEAEPECWKDPKVWAKANPMLGKSVSTEFLDRECKRAQESPAYENTFKRLYLNLQTESDIRWFSMDNWDACAGILPDLAGRECYGGLDLASISDLAALALVFPREEVNGGYDVLVRFWCPEESARIRELKDHVPYTQWIREGLITATPGNVIDYDAIRRDINELNERYNIKEIAVDRWNSTQLQTQLMGDGFEIIQFGQGYASMNSPAKELQALILDGKLAHGAHPVLRWMASNVMIEMNPAGDIKPSKLKSSEKIDGIVALVMAIGRAMLRDESGSVYESRGLEIW